MLSLEEEIGKNRLLVCSTDLADSKSVGTYFNKPPTVYQLLKDIKHIADRLVTLEITIGLKRIRQVKGVRDTVSKKQKLTYSNKK